MALMGLKDQFCPMAEDGSKTHSIRGGFRWKVGMRADLYRESRQRKVYELARIEGDPNCVCLGDGLLGMECHAERHSRYEQVQVSGMRLMFRAPVVRVQPIEVSVQRISGPVIAVEGLPLTDDEADLFAWRDGFRHYFNGHPSEGLGYGGCFALMMDFWERTHRISKKPFRGQIIHWDYAARFVELPVKAKRAKRRVAPKQHPCEYIDPVTHYDPPFGGGR